MSKLERYSSRSQILAMPRLSEHGIDVDDRSSDLILPYCFVCAFELVPPGCTQVSVNPVLS